MSSFDRPVVLFTNSPAMGGMEQHVLLLASGLVERGIETAVVCSPRPEIAPLRDQLVAAGVELHTPGDRQGAFGAPARWRELAAVFRRYRRGILHVHSTGFHGGDLVMVAGRRAGMAAIVRTEHVPPQPPVDRRQRVQVRWRDRLLLSKVICVSAANRREHVEILGRRCEKLTVIPNGIDLGRFEVADGSGARAELGLAGSSPLVGVVARLAEPRKGVAEFIRAAATVLADRPDVRFVVVGDGPLRPSLEQLADGLGLGAAVEFLGEVPDVIPVMSAMDVFVMPSTYEGGPLTLLEAMALGRPVVTTPVGVATDVVDDGRNGLVVPAGDVGALAAAVSRLLGDRALGDRLGAAARDDARRSFGIDRMVERTIDLYRELAPS